MPRIKEPGGGYYHIVSRVVDRRKILNGNEKDRFRTLMRKVEAFCGVRILTYAVLGNHFHILVHVPAPQPVGDDLFRERLFALYDKALVERTMRRITELRDEGRDAAAEEIKAPYVARMCELSAFGKTLKQRFSQSYNRRHGRKGTLWEERFKSLLVESSRRALSAVAAYIDLNAVRAGIVREPGAYRFCGYSEAMRGSRLARTGLAAACCLAPSCAWAAVQSEYGGLLHGRGPASGAARPGAATNTGVSRRGLKAALDGGANLPLELALLCRVRYFTDGEILGSRAYVEEALRRHRDRLGLEVETNSHDPAHVDLGGLRTARRLGQAAVTVPGC
jgi:REP element-mobilizing transposase RayT